MSNLLEIKKNENLTVNDALELFLKYLEGIKRSEATIKTYKKNLGKLFKYLGTYYNCKIYVDEVKADDLERYLYEEYHSKDYSSAYRFNIITAFKCFFSFCYKKELCKVNIAKQVVQVKRRVKERTYLTEIEVEKLLNEIEHPLINAVVSTMYYAGLRINECIKLTVEDVSFEKNSITVKDNRQKNIRIIPMNLKLKRKLIEYSNSNYPKKESNNFFSTRTGSLSANYTNLMIKEACSKANVTKNVTCHIFRHSFASNLVLKGADIGQVQKLLGHTDLKSTDIYLHANVNELRKTVGLMS